MGAVNCPETPRQKMVGIMYLVLTAMLALNVSSSVLDAFSKVQAGLTQTVDNYGKMSKQIYAEFDNAYALNENNLIAEETLFIDDLKENTAAAGVMGIHTWNLRPHQEDVTQLFIKKQHLF